MSATTTYRTFIRSATSWETLAQARKTTDMRGLSEEDARDRCREWNKNRTAAQVRKGTKLEYEAE